MYVGGHNGSLLYFYEIQQRIGFFRQLSANKFSTKETFAQRLSLLLLAWHFSFARYVLAILAQPTS